MINKDKHLHIRIENDLHKKASKLAKSRAMDLSKLVRFLLERELEGNEKEYI